MTGTKLGIAYKEYNETNRGLVQWIIGLTMAEIALVVSERIFVFDWLFYAFWFFAGSTMIFAIIIMYVIAANADIELFSAMIVEKVSNISDLKFEESYNKRFGKIDRILTDFMIDRKAYRFLVLFYLICTIAMVLLLVINRSN